MGNLAQIPTAMIPQKRINEALAPQAIDPRTLPHNEQQGHYREAFLKPILKRMEDGLNQSQAVQSVLDEVAAQPQSLLAQVANKISTRNQTMPTKGNVCKWIKAYKKDGIAGITPQRKGRQKVNDDLAWMQKSLELFHLPSQPAKKAVYRKLTEDYGFSISYNKVLRFLNQMPAQLGDKSPYRIGVRTFQNTQTPVYHRTVENLDVGEIYTGDGHTIDVYFEHPVTGHIWRAELIIWMDVKTRYIVGWQIETAEHAYGTINAISEALDYFDHVPVFVHVDNGSGYKSRIMSDENVGFYARMGIKPIFAIPGRPTGKGIVERFFRTMEEDFNVFYGEAFCGNNHSEEHLRNFVNACKRGLAKPVNLDQWCADFELWLDKYHNRPHPEFRNTTPAQMWQGLKPTPTHMTLPAMRRPHIERVVVCGEISLNNRKYRHADLLAYNGRTVVVEYDWHTDKMVLIRYQDRLVCEAHLVHKESYLPDSYREEQKQKSLAAAEKRLQRKLDEKRARSGNLIDGSVIAQNTAALSDIAAEPQAIETKIKLDLTDIN